MSNQPQAHVADERAAFDEAYRSYSSHPNWSHSDAACDSHWSKLAGHIWRAARAFTPAGANVAADILTWQVRMDDYEEHFGKSSARTALFYAKEEIADLRARLADGAPAETPKPVVADPEWPAGEQEAFRLGVIAGKAAQPAPTSATDAEILATMAEHLMAIDGGYACDLFPEQVVAAVRAAMRVPSSPSEAG